MVLSECFELLSGLCFVVEMFELFDGIDDNVGVICL